MNVTRSISWGMSCGIVGCLWLTVSLCGRSSGDDAAPANNNKPSHSASAMDRDSRLPVEAARDRAKTMHHIYAATLEVMHHRYFHGDRAAVPARAMEDIFSEIKRQSRVEARWISVNTNPMSIDHQPKSDFEKRAARELADGKPEVEVLEGGYYRRAGAIPLTAGCISCHEGFFQNSSTAAKFAGLVISVPVRSQTDSAERK
jgi:hypothetical protein